MQSLLHWRMVKALCPRALATVSAGTARASPAHHAHERVRATQGAACHCGTQLREEWDERRKPISRRRVHVGKRSLVARHACAALRVVCGQRRALLVIAGHNSGRNGMGAENRSAAAGCTWGRGRWLHATRVQPYESRDYYSNSSSRQQQCGGGGGGDRGEQDQERLRLHNAQWLGLPAAAALVLIWRERADCEATQTHKKVEVLRLSTPHQVQKIAGLVNALVDMDYWTEEEEQYIFEHAVRLVLEAIETILPPPMLRLMIHSDDCDGLGEEQADTLRNRLVEYCKWKLQLPFLDNMDEVRVITAVCAVLVESLKKGNSFENVVEPVNSGELILDVFVKGAVGLLDQAHQKEFIATIAGGMEIPFVPEWILKWVVSKFITEVAMAFEDSLLYTYSIRISKSYDLAAERVGAARTTKSFCEMRDRKPHHPFALLHKVTAAEFVGKAPLFESGRLWANGQLLLPSDESVNYGEEVRNKLVKDLNDRINVIGWVCDKFEQWEGIIISKIVDITLLESMDMEKMEVAKELAKRDMSKVLDGEGGDVSGGMGTNVRRRKEVKGRGGGLGGMLAAGASAAVAAGGGAVAAKAAGGKNGKK